MIKRPLTRIAYSLGWIARPFPPHGDPARGFATFASVRPPWTHWNHHATTVLLSAEEAKDQLREIIEGSSSGGSRVRTPSSETSVRPQRFI